MIPWICLIFTDKPELFACVCVCVFHKWHLLQIQQGGKTERGETERRRRTRNRKGEEGKGAGKTEMERGRKRKREILPDFFAKGQRFAFSAFAEGSTTIRQASVGFSNPTSPPGGKATSQGIVPQ